MKKIVALMVVVCLIVPFTQIFAEENTEILNPSFENGEQNWETFAIGREPSKLEICSDEFYAGKKSAKINPGSKGVTGISQVVSVKNNETINISVMTKTKGESWLEVVQLKNKKPVGKYRFEQSGHVRKNTDWEMVKLNVDILPITEELEIHLMCKQGVTYFDDIRFEKATSENSLIFSEFVDPSLARPGTKLHLSFVCHVEPHRQYRQEGYTKERLKGLDDFVSMLESFGAKLTLQIQQPFTTTLKKMDLNPFTDLELSGHEVCTHYHENVYVQNNAPYEKRKQALSDLKDDVDSFGVSNLTLCGGWQQKDIVRIAGELGYKYLDNYKYAPTQEGSEAGLTVNPYRPAKDDIEEPVADGKCLYLPEGPWGMATKPASIKHNASPEMFDAMTEMINSALPMLELGRVNCANVVMHLNDFGPGHEKTLELYRSYFEEILSPHAETGLIEFATISEAGKLYEDTEEKGISMLPQVITVVNGNYFDDEIEAKKAVSNLRKQVEICEKYSVEAEHYFTWFAWKQTNELDSDYYDWISSTDGINIHCHGENRNPPNPSLIARMKNQVWDRDYNIALDFQTHVVDINSGKITDVSGGAKEVIAVSGSDVVSCGRAVKGAILKANKDIGFNVGVGFGDSMGVPSNRCFMMDVLGRPDDVFIHPNDEFLPWIKGRYDLKGEVLKEIRKLDYFEPRYLMFVIHDWDMFRYVDETKAWEHYDEVLRWLIDELGCVGSSIEQMYSHANHRGIIEKEWASFAAKELIDDLQNDGELNNFYESNGNELTLSELFQGCLLEGNFKPKDIIGPTIIFDDVENLVLSKMEIEYLIESIRFEISTWESIPSSFEVGGKTLSAGQMLYILCLDRVNGIDGVAEIPKILNNPESAYPLRFDFDTLQLWTHRPAHYVY